MTRHLPAAALLLLLSCPAAVLAQGAPAAGTAGPTVAFPPVTDLPIPLQSTSGRFSSLNPPRQAVCRSGQVTGSVVSARLIQLDGFVCRTRSHPPLMNVLMNIKFGDPANVRHMVTGRRVALEGTLKIAEEFHGPYLVFFLIAEQARLVAGDPPGAPAPASTSYMICQPPELDALASKIGSELCVQSTIVANLNEAGAALEAAAQAPNTGLQPAPQLPRSSRAARVVSDTVSSHPAVITCRSDPERSDTHLAAIACARGSYWAWWHTKHRLGQDFTKAAPP